MAIPDDEIAQVRDSTDIVALIGEQVALRKTGQRWTGLCPFHSEKTGSFSVNAEQGFYYCFGCHKSGDAITFVRETQHLDFLDAVRQLAERAGITLTEDNAESGGWRDKAVLYDAVERAVAWYHERLLQAPDAGRARDYLRSRGYDAETVRAFKLGWAPDDWDQLAKALRLTPEVATKSGLGFMNKREKLQDSLRNRVLFPIFEVGGRAVAFGGRILPTADGSPPARDGYIEPKYKNTQETAIYSKRRTLYALNWAKQDVVRASELIVCEGYTDVIAFFRAGVPRAVATCGTALSEDHFRVMKNFAKRIVLAYDADAAGQNAAASVYQWERAHEVNVAVAKFPRGMDPAELAREDPAALEVAVRDAVPFLQFRLDAVLNVADLDSPEGRARTAERALAVIAEHPSDLVRDQYVMQVADRCRIDAARLREGLARQQRSGDGPGPRESRTATIVRQAPSNEGERPELEALRLAVHSPDRVLPRLRAVLFADGLHRRAFESIELASSATAAIDAADERGEDDVVDLLRRLAVEEPVEPTDGGDLVTAVVAQLIRQATRAVLAQRQDAIRAGTVEVKDVFEEIALAKQLVDSLEGPDAEAVERELVEWLSTEEARDAPV